MKFLHTADIHLGATPDSNMPWGGEREKEIWHSFQNLISVCNEEKVDLLLIAGDLFHRQPLVRELKEVNYYFSRLISTRVVLMAGNHDFIGARSNYPGFEWNDNVHMFLGDRPEKIELKELGVCVYGFSYHTRDITEPIYDTMRPENNGYISILLAHGGDERDVPMNRKKLMASGFDYIALGHIHKPEMISSNMAYPGSLEPIDKNELGERGYILGDIMKEEGKPTTSICFVPSCIREYKKIILTVTPETTMGSLLDQARDTILEKGKEHIYSIELCGIRDELIHFDKEELLKLGNVLEVEDNSVPDYDFDALLRENSDNVIGMFIQRIRENATRDEVARKALYYGIEALLGSKN